MEIDLDQYGTPGWLTPLGRLDPTEIRKKNREKWLREQQAKQKLTNGN
jgi:hypothetical protein